MLAFLFISQFLYRVGGGFEWTRALSAFFSPGFKFKPEQWVLGQLILFGMASAGLACLAVAAIPRGAGRSSVKAAFSLRATWRQFIWAVLLGSYGAGLVFTLLDLTSPYGFGGQSASLLQQVGFWTNLIRLACGVIICARLLFARERKPYEKVLGYILAALALYGLAWTLLRVLGLDLNAMLAHGGEPRPLLLRLWDETFGIAFSCAAAWTGLFMARHRTFVPPETAFSVPATVYLCGASVLFNLGLNRAFNWDMFDEMSAAIIGYCAASFVYVAFALLALLHATRLATGAMPEPVEGPQAEPVLDGRWRKRLLVETPIGLAVSVALMGLGYLVVNGIPLLALAFLMPLAMLLLFAGPILVFVYGILRGRVGYSIGAALLALGLFGYRSFALMQVAAEAKATVAEASALTIYPFKPAKQQHTTVAVVDSYTSPVDHVGCYERCRLVLLSSTYTYAVEDPARQTWHILRLVRDPAVCSAPEKRESMLDFLALGQVDTCAVESSQAPGADALIIRENQSENAPIKRQFPKGFRGNAYELLERIDGKDELLGRIVWGGVQPPLLSDQKGESVKFALDEKGFYAVALNLPGPTPPPITAEHAEAAIAAYLDQWTEKFDGAFLSSWMGFLSAPKEPAATRVVQDAVFDLIRSDDPARSRFGLHALFSFGDDASFVKESLGQIVTSDRMKTFAEKPDNLLEMLKRIRGAYPEPERAAARVALQRPGAKSETELLALLSVLGHGGAEQRAEAVAVVLAMPEAEFQRTMAVLGFDKLEIVTEPPLITFWSETDIVEIARRAPAVPDALLANYIQTIRYTLGFAKVRGNVKDLLDARLASGPADEKVRQDLQGLRDRL